jgi:hypothetical protein
LASVVLRDYGFAVVARIRSKGRSEAGRRIAQKLSATDVEGLDPALLPERETNEKAQLDEFFDREVPVQLFPQHVIGDLRVPDYRAGIGQSDLFAFGNLPKW